jgi:hypothetical protein
MIKAQDISKLKLLSNARDSSSSRLTKPRLDFSANSWRKTTYQPTCTSVQKQMQHVFSP